MKFCVVIDEEESHKKNRTIDCICFIFHNNILMRRPANDQSQTCA